MNFVTSVFKKYMNKNEPKVPDHETSRSNADEPVSPKKNGALKQPRIEAESLLTGQAVDEDETFQDAEQKTDNQEIIVNEQTFFTPAQHSGQSSTQPGLNRISAEGVSQPCNKKRIGENLNYKAEILQEDLQRNSFTFNITEPDSLNTSMVDSLEASKSSLLPDQELTDSIEVLRDESSRESSFEPATLNAEEDADEYVSLSQILSDSIEESSEHTVLESSLNETFKQEELGAKCNNSDEESEGALEKLIRNVNETLVLGENGHQTNFDNSNTFESVDALQSEESLKSSEKDNMSSVDLWTEELKAKANIPNDQKSDTDIKEQETIPNFVAGELEKAGEANDDLLKESSYSEKTHYTNIKTENVNLLGKYMESVELDQNENSSNVENKQLEETTDEKVDAVPQSAAKDVQVEDANEDNERIRIYERQETQEFDAIVKKLQASGNSESSLDHEKRVPFDRQDTQEFEKLERKFEGTAESSNATDDILDILMINDRTYQDEKNISSEPPKKRAEGVEEEKQELQVEEQAQNLPHDELNYQSVNTDTNHDKIEYQRQDTQEFENLERQYADDILDQLVAESNQGSSNEELSINASSPKAATSNRSDFLLGMIEEINPEHIKRKERVAFQGNNLHCIVGNSSQIELHQKNKQSKSQDVEESIKEEELDESEATDNQDVNSGQIVAGTSKKDQLGEESEEADIENDNVACDSQNFAHSEKVEISRKENASTSTKQLERNEGSRAEEESTNKENNEVLEHQIMDNSKQGKAELINEESSTTNSIEYGKHDINSIVTKEGPIKENVNTSLKSPNFSSSGVENNVDQASPDKLANQMNEKRVSSRSHKSEKDNKLISSQLNNEERNVENKVDLEKKIPLKNENSVNRINKYRKLLDQYEKRILEQSTVLEKLKTESDMNFRHFTNTEMAFSDLFEKYEKAKSVIMLYKQNEDTLVENIQMAEEQFTQLETKCVAMKRQSVEQIRRAQQETEEEKQKYRRDLAKLQAQLKRLEIKATSLEVELSQKTEECRALASLCDEITGRH